MLMNDLVERVVMHDTISTDETPQNENAAPRYNTLLVAVYNIKSLENQGLFFTSILGAEPSKKVMPP